jgi:two-component system CheB/CheR fusion protein
MPQAAVATGCVDFVLPPEGIAAELVRIGRHPYIANAGRAQLDVTAADDEEWFGAILGILHGATGIDFSRYREKMIKRRILRRLALGNIAGLAEYCKRLERDSGELAALQRDLLISVTGFFRDREVFERLKRVVFPRILEGRPANETIRVWVAGCATGEEAFSIAIALQEYLDEVGASFPVKIFASDISLAVIEKARTGKFIENIAADISHERLNRYFTKVEGGYQIVKALREMCVFTRHNLMEDPPFSKLDLISCRNVLIYLGSVQTEIVSLFHYALKSTGFLLLGTSEAVTSGGLFTAADREHRIYARRESAKRPHFLPTGGAGLHRSPATPGGATMAPTPELWSGFDGRREVDRILLSKYSPAGVVVDDDLEVVEIRGKASPYLTLPAGRVSFNLMRLIPDTGLLLDVEKLIQQARKSGSPARRERVPHELDGKPGAVTVEVVPLDSSHKHCHLVLFEPIPDAAGGEPAAADPSPGGDARDGQIARLQQQLADATERLLEAMEEHQSSREESQNITEEALSANEELQSLNEDRQGRIAVD